MFTLGLQTELNAANKEADIVRQKIRHLENELENYRKRNFDLTEEIQNQKGWIRLFPTFFPANKKFVFRILQQV